MYKRIKKRNKFRINFFASFLNKETKDVKELEAPNLNI